MKTIQTLLSRALALFRRRPIERDLDDELQNHIAMLADENVSSGMTPEEAHYAARRSFGGVEQVKEVYRDRRSLPLIETVVQDLRYAARMLRKSPGFTTVAVVSLALGIGANTAIFTLVNAIMLRMLPVENPRELVLLKGQRKAGPAIISFPVYRELRARQQVFSGIFASAGETPTRVTIQAPSGPVEIDNVRPSFVTANYWNVLGIHPVLGRFFTEEEDRDPNRSETQGSVVVLSYSFWERQFGGNPAVLGKTILIGSSACRVIGVAPRGFSGEALGGAPDAWAPLIRFSSADELENRRGVFTLYMARLKPGVTREQAQAAATLLFQQSLAEERSQKPSGDYSIELQPGDTGADYFLRRTFGKALYLMMAVAGLVLLIACANIANLLLARATRRQREIRVRLALGCGRLRLIRQLLTESVLLSGLGAIAGLALAYWGSRQLLRMVDIGPSAVPLHVIPDGRVLAFMAAVVLLSGIGFGIAPALRASGFGLGTASPRVGQRFSRILVGAQVALSLLLLIGAGLLARSVHNLHAIDLGFRPQQVVIFDLAHGFRNRDPEAMARVVQQVYDRAQRVPGVQSASLSSLLLFSPSDISAPLRIEGYTPAADESIIVRFNSVSPRYFETIGMTLREGRGIEARDTRNSPFVAVINESMERRYFGRGSAIGRTIEITRPLRGKLIQVVGVVGDAKYNDLRAEPKPMFYIPLLQQPRSLRSLEVRTTEPASALAGPIRQALLEASKDIMIRRVFPLVNQVDRTLASERMIATLCSFFGILALILASVGLYGVMSYAVAQRTSEIGIRMALGATGGNVLAMVLRQGLTLVAIGIVAGIALALGSTRLVAAFLYGLSPTDLSTIAIAVLVLATVSLVAGYLPARRATRVDPMIALRYE